MTTVFVNTKWSLFQRKRLLFAWRRTKLKWLRCFWSWMMMQMACKYWHCPQPVLSTKRNIFYVLKFDWNNLKSKPRKTVLTRIAVIQNTSVQNSSKLMAEAFEILLLLLYNKCFFSLLSVSVADLQTHSELDPDSDGSFTEAEAQVSFNFHWMRNVTHAKNFGKPNCFFPLFLCTGTAGRSGQSWHRRIWLCLEQH